MLETASACQKTFFDTLPDCKNVRKTSSLHPSAYNGTVGCKLCSKSKSLQSKLFVHEKYLNTFVIYNCSDSEKCSLFVD